MNWMLISPMTCRALASLLVYSSIVSFTVSLMRRRRIYGDTVSGVDTGTLDMLHDTRNQDIGSVAHRVNLNLFAHAGIYQRGSGDPARYRLMMPMNSSMSSSLDTRSACPVRPVHRTGAPVPDSPAQLRCLLRFLSCKYGVPRRLSEFWHLLQNLIKQLSVLRRVYILCRGSKDRHAHLHQSSRSA